MTIASEISRLQCAKADICTAIENKGVTVGNITLDNYACCIDAIQSGASITPNIELMVVGGGGGGGSGYSASGGGGGGGVKYCRNYCVEVGCSYGVTIGNGGNGGSTMYCSVGCDGGTSCFGNIIAGGGGGGGYYCNDSLYVNGGDGYCGGGGGGGARGCSQPGNGGVGGYRGGYGNIYGPSGGGGGARGIGCDYFDAYSGTSTYVSGSGGIGFGSEISGSYHEYGGGGGGHPVNAGNARCWCSYINGMNGFEIGKGGGISGGDGAYIIGQGGNGKYCGGGGGGGGCGGNGIKGIVIARYRTDGSDGINCATGGTKYTCGDYTIHCFTSNGTFTIVS